jgi:hypothetical protein
MAHWFDRLSRVAAGDAGVSRRGLLVSTGLAAFGSTVLASDSFALQAGKLEARAAQTACEDCLNSEIKDHKKNLKNCDKTGNIFGIIPNGPSKGKKPAKAPPVPAAKKLACVVKAEAQHAFWMNDCARFKCRAPGMKQQPPATNPDGTPVQGGPACAPGTSLCSQVEGLCCYGDDACCVCGKTHICCAAVVGCTCC